MSRITEQFFLGAFFSFVFIGSVRAEFPTMSSSNAWESINTSSKKVWKDTIEIQRIQTNHWVRQTLEAESSAESIGFKIVALEPEGVREELYLVENDGAYKCIAERAFPQGDIGTRSKELLNNEARKGYYTLVPKPSPGSTVFQLVWNAKWHKMWIMPAKVASPDADLVTRINAISAPNLYMPDDSDTQQDINLISIHNIKVKVLRYSVTETVVGIDMSEFRFPTNSPTSFARLVDLVQNTEQCILTTARSGTEKATKLEIHLLSPPPRLKAWEGHRWTKTWSES